MNWVGGVCFVVACMLVWFNYDFNNQVNVNSFDWVYLTIGWLISSVIQTLMLLLFWVVCYGLVLMFGICCTIYVVLSWKSTGFGSENRSFNMQVVR